MGEKLSDHFQPFPLTSSMLVSVSLALYIQALHLMLKRDWSLVMPDY